MQKYRMFENLLGLRVSEIKVLQCTYTNHAHDKDDDMEKGKFGYFKFTNFVTSANRWKNEL